MAASRDDPDPDDKPRHIGSQGVWYFLLTFGSFGTLAWIPYLHAAAWLRNRTYAILACVYAALTVISFVLIGSAPENANGETVGMGKLDMAIGYFILVGIMGAASTHQSRVRQEVYGSGRRRALRARSYRTDPAVTRALDARIRRAQARTLIEKDPLLAHELRVGRPELTRPYDDGGLVDLNAATAKSIAQACEVPPHVARNIVEARTERGGFLSVDDVLTCVEVPMEVWPIIRDRAVVIVLN